MVAERKVSVGASKANMMLAQRTCDRSKQLSARLHLDPEAGRVAKRSPEQAKLADGPKRVVDGVSDINRTAPNNLV